MEGGNGWEECGRVKGGNGGGRVIKGNVEHMYCCTGLPFCCGYM